MAKQKRDDLPAFPRDGRDLTDPNGDHITIFPQAGMTLRQWYAGNAPASIEAMINEWSVAKCREYLGVSEGDWTHHHYVKLVAKVRFEYADAMIAESEKE